MTPQHEFMNRLKILYSLDRDEIETAGLKLNDTGWRRFQSDPPRWMLWAADGHKDKIWALVDKRMGKGVQE